MKKHIYDEQNGLRYTLHGDVYLPDLAVSGNEHKPLGKYGLMRRTYLREHHKTLYIQLQARGELWQHLYEVDEQAQVLKEVQPTFPARAKKLGISGYVKVMIVIDVYGDVSQASVMSMDPPGYGFDTEALKAIRQWKFSPAQLGGYPVAQKATKEFRFVK